MSELDFAQATVGLVVKYFFHTNIVQTPLHFHEFPFCNASLTDIFE
jgi:hypothetical protein